MNETSIATPHDPTVSRHVEQSSAQLNRNDAIISSLWIAVLITYAYIDLFGFFRKDLINGVLVGELTGTPLAINQGFLMFATVYVIPGIVMIPLSLLMTWRRRWVIQLIVATTYVITIMLSVIGETYLYYVVGSAVEVALLAMIVRFSLRTRHSS